MTTKPAPRPSSNVPLARTRLLFAATELGGHPDPVVQGWAREIALIVATLMRRRYTPVPASPPRLNSLTPKTAAAIRALKAAQPDLSQVEIGRHFGVGAGRVSEALAGHDASPPNHLK